MDTKETKTKGKQQKFFLLSHMPIIIVFHIVFNFCSVLDHCTQTHTHTHTHTHSR